VVASQGYTHRGIVSVTYHQFFLADHSISPITPPTSTTGLVDAVPGAAIVYTGIHTGVVSLDVEARSESPAILSRQDWDEIAEVSVSAPVGRLSVTSLLIEGMDIFPVLTAAGPGAYRIRVHARGRDTDIDGVAFEPFEDYLIQVWPATFEPQTTYKQTDRYGAQLRRDRHDICPSAPPTHE